MGDRYGKIIKIGRANLHVAMDVSGKTRKVAPCNIFDVYPSRTIGLAIPALD